jgi:enoyl-CoA hydratase/carnithine racemase
MVLHCDVRFAANPARVGQPEVDIGFIPPVGATVVSRLAQAPTPQPVDRLVLLSPGPGERRVLPLRAGHSHPRPPRPAAGPPPEVLALLAPCLDDEAEALDAAASRLLRERADRLLAAFTTAGLMISAGALDRLSA